MLKIHLCSYFTLNDYLELSVYFLVYYLMGQSFDTLGEFGDVYKGTLTLEDGKTILVAAKTLKVNAWKHFELIIILSVETI